MQVNVISHWLAIWGCRGVYSFFSAPGEWRPHINKMKDTMDIIKMKRWCENISILEAVLLYQRLMDNGKISRAGAASKRLAKLREYRKKGYKRFENILESDKY